MNTVTNTPAMSGTRANGHGDPCPPWCITDHSLKFSSAHVGTPHGAGGAWACAVRSVDGEAVAVDGHTGGEWASLKLTAAEAGQLAALLGMAGDGSELAAAIRAAVSELTGLAAASAR